ncbi:MAG TPA: hypothetical protein VK157_03965 [Phycisphaerales bacterium]|nr:hypothetical protein [Phycisphaerales bacterium]
MSQDPSNAPPTTTDVSALVAALARLRSAIRLQLVFSRVGLIVATVCAAALVLGLLDYFLRLPRELRVLLWVGGLMTVAMIFYRRVLPAVRFRPSDTDLALRLEKSELGKQRGWQGLLASGVELANSGAPHDPRLAQAASEIARERFLASSKGVLSTLDTGTLRRSLGALVLAGGLIAAISFANPALFRVGSLRVLTPWTQTQWPKRTGVVAAGTPAAHPLGTALPLRALLLRSPRPVNETNITLNYRVSVDGKTGATQRALLTPQGRKLSHDPGLGAQLIEGDLFERLLDTQGLVPTGTQQATLEYWFETSDDATAPLRVTLVEPPAIVGTTVSVTPPAYLAQLGAAAPQVLSGDVDAGNGLDQRALVGPLLAGSRVQMRITMSKDVVTPADVTADWLKLVLPGVPQDASASITPREWTVTFNADETLRISPKPVDVVGISPREDATYRLDVIADRPPVAAVIGPAQDETVLPTAVIEAIGEGRDDIAIASVTLRTQLAKADPTSAGAAPEPAGEPQTIATSQPTDADSSRTLQAATTLDLATLNPVPGDEVWLTAHVRDAITAFASADATPAATDGVTSPVRRLRFISPSELVEQLRQELTGLRDATSRLDAEQNALREALPQSTANNDEARDAARQQAGKQGGVEQRLKPLTTALSKLQERASRNRLDDAAFNQLLQDARDSAEQASQAADEAQTALDALSQQTDQQQREQSATAAEQSQKRVSDELNQLMQMLSEGQDDWAARRSIEQLLTEQRQLRAQTAATGEQNQGQRAQDLSQKQRDDLERLARRQREMAQRTDAAIEQLEQRAKQLEETSPAQSQAMQQAAQRARQQQASERQRQAAQQVQQNQTGQAQQNQQAAEDALEEVLQALDDTQKARDEQLRRTLADVLQSLDQLIARQQTEIARAGKALAGEIAPNLDGAMVQLHQNTLAVLAKVKREAQNADKLFEFIESATDAQASAIVSLRDDPADYAAAEQTERVALARLKDAREEAAKLDQQAENRDQDRTRRELKKAYTEALELQAQINAETKPLVGIELDRRTRSQLRQLGQRQQELRQRLAEIRSQTEELGDAKVFDFAHKRLDEAMANASAAMTEGRNSRAVLRDQLAAQSVLQSMVEALKQAESQQDGLSEGQQGGSGSGSGSGQPQPAVPPAAELLLLRGMQAETLARTKALSEDAAQGEPGELDAVSKLQQDIVEQSEELIKRLQGGVEPEGVPQPPAVDEQQAPQDDENEKKENGGGT